MTTWWTSERITATVNQAFIEKELGSKKHQDLLHSVLAFGDGLTDDTYLDCVLERSPRFFLVLNDIGVPEKIFDIIDRSFDDDDLPLSEDALWELNLFGTNSETLDKKFFRHQFSFLIQELEPGGHVDYTAWDVVPVEQAVRRPSLPTNAATTDRVLVRGISYTRKRMPSSGDTSVDRIRFIMHLSNIAALQHQHLVTVWATYSQNELNFVLLSPACDLTLKHILEEKEQSKTFKALEKHERRQIFLTWAHCLTSGLAYLHSRGFVHKAIRPSTISIDQNCRIYLNDYDAIQVLDMEESPNPYKGEIYEHAAPENWQRKPCLHESSPLKTVLPGGGRTSRRLPKTQLSASDSRRPSLIGQESISRSASRSQNSSSGSSTHARPRNTLITTFAPPGADSNSLPTAYYPSDVFSLTTVLLTIYSYLLGHSPKSFASFRSKLNRQAGRGNAPPDASFHKNPKQVEKWIDQLAKEAGQKEKKDQRLWGSVVELVKLCAHGISHDPQHRITAKQLERKVFGWVDWGIGRRRKCTCSEQDLTRKEPTQPNAVLVAQRESCQSWSKIGERMSDGTERDQTTPVPTLRPKRNLSKRLSMDRRPNLRRDRSVRPGSSISGRAGRNNNLEMRSATPSAPAGARNQDILRLAVNHAVSPTSLQEHLQEQAYRDKPKVVHQGRSSYRIKPQKLPPPQIVDLAAPIRSSKDRRNNYYPEFQRAIEEEPSDEEDHPNYLSIGDRGHATAQREAAARPKTSRGTSARKRLNLNPANQAEILQGIPLPSPSVSSSQSKKSLNASANESSGQETEIKVGEAALAASRLEPLPREHRSQPHLAKPKRSVAPRPSSIATASDIWGLSNVLGDDIADDNDEQDDDEDDVSYEPDPNYRAPAPTRPLPSPPISHDDAALDSAFQVKRYPAVSSGDLVKESHSLGIKPGKTHTHAHARARKDSHRSMLDSGSGDYDGSTLFSSPPLSPKSPARARYEDVGMVKLQDWPLPVGMHLNVNEIRLGH